MSWNKVPIKTICKGIYDGPHATPPESSSGAVFLGIPNFINGQLDLSNIRYISEQDLPKWTKRVTPQPNDIVFSYEATLNLYAIIPKGFWGCLGRRMALIRVDEKKADYKFLYYHFYSTAWRSVIQEHTVTGATVDRIPLVSFPNFLVELPDLPTQRRIASILSAYDDLIENNRRQIKLLEEAAQRLYREWFVELRFPGHESVKVVDGVPEGWMKVCLKDICETKTGKKDANFGCDDGAYPFFTCAQAPIKAPSYSFDCSAVILAGNGDFNVKLYRGKFEAYQRTYVLSPANTEYLFLLYNAVSRNMNVLTKGASGSTIKFLTKGMIDSIELLIPSSQLLTTYNQNSEALQKSIEALHRKVALAVEARDRLLPKLINHEMEVML
ncbi:MAG TPA: restriction endonuclease subunit S [Clostridiales bacterium]|jgi:type I restriction-modification system specificity subunit|nr:restriction endonuclease subunit S [Clostridiales bacterium]